MKSIFIFIPDKLDKLKQGYLRGFHHDFGDCEAYYITNKIKFNKYTQNCIGYFGSFDKNKVIYGKNAIHYNSKTEKITFSKKYSDNYSAVRVIYNFEAFKTSNNLNENSSGKEFALLSEFLKNSDVSNDRHKNGHKTLIGMLVTPVLTVFNIILMLLKRNKPIINISSTLIHFQETIETINDLLRSIKNDDKVSPQSGNILVAKLIDLIAGIVLLYYLLEYEDLIVDAITNSTEVIIINLKELLLYLMGAPIGLKLNYAFNMSLGNFFFYHISLWRIFLHGIQPLFTQYYKVLVLPLTCGLSFQIAMLSDIISIATFHVYCIYVYAARLFYLQLRGLTSLWRLFIGRKYNPLRGRVDSCEYSQHQLFVGTLAFTVLLFLLPTTLLYYTVFTSLRLVILLSETVLIKARYLLKHLPVYIILLWLWKSYTLPGVLYLEWRETKEREVYLKANLNTLSLFAIISALIPNESPTRNIINWKSAFNSIFTGILL